MTYTFDELEKKLEEALDSIGAPTDASNKIGDAIEILDNLREEYAPTVEMTKHQKFVFMRLHENKKPVFVDIDTVYNTPEFASIDTDLLILAWFHPEIIKVVDE